MDVRNLQSQVDALMSANEKLQRAVEERDKQLQFVQQVQRTEHMKLYILARCKVVPQGLDLSLVNKSKTYGLMTALFDAKTAVLLDYNRNYAKLLRDIYGPDYESKKILIAYPGGSIEQVIMLWKMLIEDGFKETVEKYAYIQLPTGERLPFLLSISIQCWERPEGPVVSCTYWI